MSTRRRYLALKSTLAFAVALGLGRVLVSTAPQAEPQVVVAAPEAPVTPATLVKSAPATPAAEIVKDPMRPVIDQNFKIVDGGVLNDNARLSHFLPSHYAEGTLHKVSHQFGATVRYLPAKAELLRGNETVAVIGEKPSSRAKLLTKGERNHVMYPATYPDTDEHLYIRPDGGIEHDYILKQRPAGMDDSHALAYSGYLQLSPGLTLWDGKNQITSKHVTKNGINIKNNFGNTVLYLRRPVAWDALVTTEDGLLDKAKQSEESFRGCAVSCEYQIDFDESGIKLSVVTSGRWLAHPSRVFPVTIDPNFGPFGLADGDPPIYTGTAGADTLIPANAGGTPLVIVDQCPTKPDNGYGVIPMPFAFEYYGTNHAANSSLFVHIDGFASWTQPAAFPLQPNPCQDTDNQAIPTGGYPDDAFFAYWDDLRFSTVAGAGIYYFIDGAAPARRLVVQWYKMGFARGSNTEVISFNLVLYECENKIQFIIGQADEVDPGLASVGIEDQTGLLGIQYDFNSALGGLGGGTQFNQFNPFFNNFGNNGGFGGGFGNGGFGGGFFGGGGFGGFGGFGGTPTGGAGGGITNTGSGGAIVPGTSVAFQRSALGFLVVGTTPRAGCIPWTVCFDTEVTVPASSCSTGTAIPTSFGFHWTFGDNAEGFTPDLCHTWVSPGVYRTTLEIIDEFGTTSTLEFDIRVCDVPDVVIIANPQGGYAPLLVDFEARALSPTVTLSAAPTWQVDLLGTNNEPGTFVALGSTTGSPVQARFDAPGIYRVSVAFTGLDTVSGLPTTGIGTVFIFVAAQTDVIEDSLIITESQFNIDWVGKRDGADADGLPPNNGSSVPGQGFPDSPENDTMFIRGYMSLPGVTPSTLLGRRIRVILNGVDAIFDGVLDASGTARFADLESTRTGSFNIDLTTGVFFCNVKRSLYVQLGLGDTTERRLLPAFFRIEIDGIFPPTGSNGALITYDYSSKAFNAGPPASGSGKGIYKFGGHTRDGVVSTSSSEFGRPGGQTILLTGAFMVTKAKLKLEGSIVTADVRGKLARFGGDDLRPRDTSDVIISLGGYSETLNFSTTQGFKTSGKAPKQRFSFKRSKTLTKSGFASFQWVNGAGDFRLKTYGLPNELVGLNPALGVQLLTIGLQITPENDNVYNGAARFDLFKKSPEDFVHGSRK